jgi:hypothetical protein
VVNCAIDTFRCLRDPGLIDAEGRRLDRWIDTLAAEAAAAA